MKILLGRVLEGTVGSMQLDFGQDLVHKYLARMCF